MKQLTKILALALSLVLLVTTFTACGDPVAVEDYGTTVAATFGDENIMMDEANFFLRYEQATMESYYWSMYQQYGYDNPWVAPAPGNDTASNKTMADYIKELTMQQIHQTRTLVKFAGNYGLSTDDIDVETCEAKAQEMYESLDAALLVAAPITQDQLTEWIKMNYLANLVAAAIEDQADTSYTEDEVNVYTVTYATFTDDTDYGVETTAAESETDDEGNVNETAVEETEAETDENGEVVETEEPKSGEQKAEEFLAEVKEAGDFCTAADANEDVTELSDDFLIAGDEDAEEDDNILYKKTKNLAVGEVVSFYDKSTKKYYVAERTEENNEEAVEAKTEEVVDQKKAEHFADVIDDLYSKAPSFSVTNAWKNLVVTDGNKLIPETEEAEEAEEDYSDVLPDDALNETLYVDDAEEASSVVESMNAE